MSVAFDAKGPSTGTTSSASNTISWTHTPSGTPTAAAVVIGWVDTGGKTISSVTYGGTSMSQAGSTQISASGFWKTAIFGLANPASGAQTVTVTFSGALSHGGTGQSITVTGSDTTTCFTGNASTSGTTDPASLSVTSQNDELVIDVFCDNTRTLTSYGSGQTETTNAAPTSGLVYGSRKASAGSSETITINWSGSGEYAHSAASFKLPGAGPAPTLPQLERGTRGLVRGLTRGS